MPDNKRKITAKDLWNLKFIGDPQVSPDGKEAVFTLTTVDSDKNGYRTGLAVVPLDGSNPPRQITNIDRPHELVRDSNPRYSPDGKSIAFLSNRSGKNQVWVLPNSIGEPYRLTSMEDSVSEIDWSPCGERIVFVCREPVAKKEGQNKDVRVITRLRYKANGVGFTDERPRHIFMVSLKTKAVTQLTGGQWDDFSPKWSPDGKKVAFLSCREPDCEIKNHPDVWVLDIEKGVTEKITKSVGPCSNPVWAPCGCKIAYFGSDEGDAGASNTKLFVAGIGSDPVCLTNTFDRSMGSSVNSDSRYDSASSGPMWSLDSTTIYFLATDRGQACVWSVPAAGGEVDRVITAPGLTINSVDGRDDGHGMVFAYNGGTHLNPGDVFTGTEPKQLTRINEELLSGIDLAAHERFVYEGDGGWEIEGWIMKPAGFEAGKKYPVIVQIHGGPASTVGEGFFHEYQLMAARGYAVFYMNFRGSKGYGEAFARGIIGDWGGGEYRDIMLGTDHIQKTDWVDEKRLYVTGGSFGGFETNWIVGHTGRFRAAVTQRSISNMYSKYGVADNGFSGNKAGFGGRDLWDSEDFIMSRSPIRYAPNVTTPILIIHSEEDYRCPMEQAEQWYTALKRLGRAPVEFVRFAGENHELSRSGKPQNRVERLERIIGWFDRHNP